MIINLFLLFVTLLGPKRCFYFCISRAGVLSRVYYFKVWFSRHHHPPPIVTEYITLYVLKHYNKKYIWRLKSEKITHMLILGLKGLNFCRWSGVMSEISHLIKSKSPQLIKEPNFHSLYTFTIFKNNVK